jgi:hypothetical protein
MPGLRKHVTAVLTVALAGTAVCVGQQRKEQPKSAEIQVWAIRATTKNKDISKELKPIAEALKKEHMKFTGFKLEQKNTGSAEIGKAYSVSLPGGYQANITPISNDGKKVKFKLEVTKGKVNKLKVTYTVEAGKFQLAGGWDLGSGDSLILAVSAK